jgi:hypothetical protein
MIPALEDVDGLRDRGVSVYLGAPLDREEDGGWDAAVEVVVRIAEKKVAVEPAKEEMWVDVARAAGDEVAAALISFL